MQNTEQPYLFTEFQVSPPAIRTDDIELSAPRVLVHALLLVATAISTTLTGAGFAVHVQENSSLIGSLLAPVLAVLRETVTGNLDPLVKGLLFTFTLLTILGAHELGHYFACRHYGIRATLPFFIPAPPTITLFGTFGAVIKIKEPIRSRRALFDIGISGPLAGFAFALPAAIIGLLFATPATPAAVEASSGGIQFQDPLLFILISKLLSLPKWIEWNPIYWAAWGTLLITALNLFPVGQLDGGHVVYAIAGKRIHKWISCAVAVLCGALADVSIVLHYPAVYLLWTLVLLFLIKVGHPPVIEEEPLGAPRIALAIIAAVVFVLCFMRFPITSG
ncbi:MAG: site-2 protease family protein [Acidobacteria bacterium]|nr:MAG: site-2 protease family protein [Acidobacteriota bacterium]